MTLGAELLMLAVDERHGAVRMPEHLPFVLAAADLIDLACRRRVEAAKSHIRLVEELPTGDRILDATLAQLTQYKRPPIANWISLSAADRITDHIAALLESGELSGRLITMQLDQPPRPFGLRITDPSRRAALVQRLVDVAHTEVELEDEAFGALAQAAELPAHTLSGLTKYRVTKRLKNLAVQFADTWRYLPGCPADLALSDADVEPGGINPAHEEPWRLLIRLAVQEAVKLCADKTYSLNSQKKYNVQITDIGAFWDGT